MLGVLGYLMLFLYILQHLNCLRLIWKSLTERRKTFMQLLGKEKLKGMGKEKGNGNQREQQYKKSSKNESQ